LVPEGSRMVKTGGPGVCPQNQIPAGVDAELDVWEGMVHGFLGGIGQLAASTEAHDLMGSFLTRCFTNSATQRS